MILECIMKKKIMRILVCSIQMEVNSFSPLRNKIEDFHFITGQEMLRMTPAAEVFLSEGDVEIIPAFYGNAVPSGTLEKTEFDKILLMLREYVMNAGPFDGVWLYMHGAMEVEDIGNGELRILSELRNMIGKKPLISLALDFHANNDLRIVEYCDIICGYKTAPHADMPQTQEKAAKLLVRCIRNNIRPKPVFAEIPLILAGDTVITASSTYDVINRKISEIERDNRILDATLFIGQNWGDTPNNRASAIVTSLPGYEEFATAYAREITELLWSVKDGFRFQVEALPPREALIYADSKKARPIFVSDSGDNVTAGAGGAEIGLFFEAFELGLCGVLFAGIFAPEAYMICEAAPVGSTVCISFGFDNCRSFNAVLKHKSTLLDWNYEFTGKCAVVGINGIDVIITQVRCAFIAPQIIESSGVKISDYHIIAVKLGYLYPKLQEIANKAVIALTDGASCVDVKKLPFRNIKRPCYPLDGIDT